MSKVNIVELAKQGNPKAIAALINRKLQPKGITVKVAVKDSCLHVILESAEVPEQQVLMPMMCKGIIGLGIEGVEQVKIYGRCTGETTPAWSRGFTNTGINKTTQVQVTTPEPQTITPVIAQTANETSQPLQNIQKPSPQKTALVQTLTKLGFNDEQIHKWQQSIPDPVKELLNKIASKPRLALVGGVVGLSALLVLLTTNRTHQIAAPPQVPMISGGAAPQPVAQNNTGFFVVGQDGAFLGVVSNDKFASDSICNQHGQYGSPHRVTSVWNKYGQYGGTHTVMGAYNPNAQRPPVIFQGRQPVAILTKNPNLQGGFDPDLLFQNVCLQQSTDPYSEVLRAQMEALQRNREINAHMLNEASRSIAEMFE